MPVPPKPSDPREAPARLLVQVLYLVYILPYNVMNVYLNFTV